MTLKSAPIYWLECDDCQVKSTNGSEYAGWLHLDTATGQASDDGWYCDDDHHWCGQCRTKHVCSECEKVTDDLVPLEEDGYWPVCRECKGADVNGLMPHE